MISGLKTNFILLVSSKIPGCIQQTISSQSWCYARRNFWKPQIKATTEANDLSTVHAVSSQKTRNSAASTSGDGSVLERELGPDKTSQRQHEENWQPLGSDSKYENNGMIRHRGSEDQLPDAIGEAFATSTCNFQTAADMCCFAQTSSTHEFFRETSNELSFD